MRLLTIVAVLLFSATSQAKPPVWPKRPPMWPEPPLVVPTPEVQPPPPAVTYSAPPVCTGGNCSQPQQDYSAPWRPFARFR